MTRETNQHWRKDYRQDRPQAQAASSGAVFLGNGSAATWIECGDLADRPFLQKSFNCQQNLLMD